MQELGIPQTVQSLLRLILSICKEDVLHEQLSGWLTKVSESSSQPNILIVPHAGYRYSGRTAGFAYSKLLGHKIHRVFLIGPSHRSYLSPPIQVSGFGKLVTPVGDLRIDREAVHASGLHFIDSHVDIAEHSLEMQFPFLRMIMEKNGEDFMVIPILVSDPTAVERSQFAKKLSHTLREDDLVVISSDFCHWGKSFAFTPDLLNISSEPALHLRIRKLDEWALASIESNQFKAYLAKTENTICGRMPILISQDIIAEMGWQADHHWKWLHYEQSNNIVDSNSDASQVSYVAGMYCQK